MKLFDDHVSFAYTHVFSAHAESCPTSAFGEPLGVYNNHRQCLDSMNMTGFPQGRTCSTAQRHCG